MKQEIIAKLVKIAAENTNQSNSWWPSSWWPGSWWSSGERKQSQDYDYRFPVSYSELEVDPAFEDSANTHTGLFSSCRDDGERVLLPVNTESYYRRKEPKDIVEMHSHPFTGNYTEKLEWLKKHNPGLYQMIVETANNPDKLSRLNHHENTHRIIHKIVYGRPNSNKRLADAFNQFEPEGFAEFNDTYSKTDEVPALAQEQLFKSRPGNLSFGTRQDGTPSRRIVGGDQWLSQGNNVDPYYNYQFPRVKPGSEKRKFYWTPRKGWVGPTGKLEEAPFDVATLEAFQGDEQPMDKFPEPWQNTVNQFKPIARAGLQHGSNKAKYQAMQDNIYRGLAPLHSRLPGGDAHKMYSDNQYKNMTIDPVPIGMAELQAKHYITPTFDQDTDVRTMEQMQDIQKDIDTSYKMDDRLRQNWAPLGGNSAGA